MKQRSPIRGYNHNIRYRGRLYHVQTEDSGVHNPHLFTHLFHAGTIISSKRTDYQPDEDEAVVRHYMQAQHKAMLKELRAGGCDERIFEVFGNLGEGPEERPSSRAPVEPPAGPRVPTLVELPDIDIDVEGTVPAAAGETVPPTVAPTNAPQWPTPSAAPPPAAFPPQAYRPAPADDPTDPAMPAMPPGRAAAPPPAEAPIVVPRDVTEPMRPITPFPPMPAFHVDPTPATASVFDLPPPSRAAWEPHRPTSQAPPAASSRRPVGPPVAPPPTPRPVPANQGRGHESIFGNSVERSLDEVILDYLAEDET